MQTGADLPAAGNDAGNIFVRGFLHLQPLRIVMEYRMRDLVRGNARILGFERNQGLAPD